MQRISFLCQDISSGASADALMNLMTHRRPDDIGWSNTCPYGGGGFHQTGRAWRFRIPPSSPLYGESIANNFLEFLGMAVNVYLMTLTASDPQQYFLVLGDNTSGLGWMKRSGHLTPRNSKYYHVVTFIARKVARLLINNDHCLARQHICGELNEVPDLLSYVGDQRIAEKKGIHPLATYTTSNEELTHSIHQHLSQLVPRDFEILPLPAEVSSFIVQALQIAELTFLRYYKASSRTTRGEVLPIEGTVEAAAKLGNYPEVEPEQATDNPFGGLIDGLLPRYHHSKNMTDFILLLSHLTLPWPKIKFSG